MKKQFLEAGKVVNTHGIRGEVKITPWTNSAEDFCELEILYIDEVPIKLLGARVHKNSIIARLDGINSVDDAVRLKNKTVFADRRDIELPKGEHFIQDIIGIDVFDADSGDKIGTVKDILPLPGGNVYEISGERTILVPAVEEFIIETDIDAGTMKVRLIEGM